MKDFQNLLNDKLYKIYLYYLHDKLGVFSLNETLSDIKGHIHKYNYDEFTNLSVNFIAESIL